MAHQGSGSSTQDLQEPTRTVTRIPLQDDRRVQTQFGWRSPPPPGAVCSTCNRATLPSGNYNPMIRCSVCFVQWVCDSCAIIHPESGHRCVWCMEAIREHRSLNPRLTPGQSSGDTQNPVVEDQPDIEMIDISSEDASFHSPVNAPTTMDAEPLVDNPVEQTSTQASSSSHQAQSSGSGTKRPRSPKQAPRSPSPSL